MALVLIFAMVQFEKHLPKEWNEIVGCADVVPGGTGLKGYPFSSLVINVGCVTDAHMDPCDSSHCLVIPFGPMVGKGENSWKGAELCMAEVGVVVALGNCQPVIFLSSGLTHFNLHGKGQRHSLVLSTDKAMLRFRENRNDWSKHMQI